MGRGRGRGRRGTPLNLSWKNACSAGWTKVCRHVSFLCYAFILASHWLVVTEKEYLNRAATFRKQWFVFIFILSNHILPPDTSPKCRRGRKKRKLKRVISFLTVHFFVSTAGQEAEIHLCVHVQFYSLRNKVDVQSLGDCQHWICFRLSCRVG